LYDDEGKKRFSILFTLPGLVWASTVITTEPNAMKLHREISADLFVTTHCGSSFRRISPKINA
jgi:hypothetical protein